QQLPAVGLLLPDLESADSGGRYLSVELGFGQEDVTRDGSIAHDRHCELGEGERLDDLLPRHDPVDELLLGLDPSVGMAVAELSPRPLLQLGPVGLEPRLPQCLDALCDGRLVAGIGSGGPCEQKAGSAERKCARNYHVATRDVHACPPREAWSTA